MIKVLIIIPAYNEEKNIVRTVNKIQNLKVKNAFLDYVIINDGSSDDTYKVINNNNFNYINLINNLGIGGAVQTGYKYALYNNYDIAIQFDGDGQHDEKFVENMIDLIVKEKCDLVIGSRFVGDISVFKSTVLRRVGIKFLTFLIKIFSKKEIKDCTSGFRACNRNIIELFARNYPIDYPEPETNLIVLKKGFKVKETSVKMYKRDNGKSSISPLKSIFYMFKVSVAIIISSIINRRG